MGFSELLQKIVVVGPIGQKDGLFKLNGGAIGLDGKSRRRKRRLRMMKKGRRKKRMLRSKKRRRRRNYEWRN